MDSTTMNEESEFGGALGARDRRPWMSTPLDTETNCIRVLHLKKGSGTMPIICDLVVVSLDADPDFEVLSYVWGDPKATRRIAVGGVAFNATVNLFDFLHCLRLPNEDRCVWADAACIDQSNDVEKSYQIGLMTKVYRQAKEAHIWFGPFDSKFWYRDMSGDKDYTMACELTPDTWKDYQNLTTKDLKYFKQQEGFKPLSLDEYADFNRQCEEDLFLHTLRMLDMMATDGHLYTYPVYFYKDDDDGRRQYGVNQRWLWIMDVVRWLLTRPWWSRVWTLQEAVLPRVDPTVHAPPYSFGLSKLLDGVQAMMSHNGNICCKWFGNPVKTNDRDNGPGRYTQVLAISDQRWSLANNKEGTGVPLQIVVGAIQRRTATEIRDHWFGVFGILPVQWQKLLQKNLEPCTTAELFTQFSRLLYFNTQNLTRLDLAQRTKRGQIDRLPSWTIDISAQRSGNEEDYFRWKLYDATPGTKHDDPTDWPDLRSPSLAVQAIRVGTVQTVADHILPERHNSHDVLQVVQSWLELYRRTVKPVADENAFWRAAFMDRNLQIHWMAKRIRPLGTPRLTDIKNWWRAWNRTNDYHDLDVDRKAGGTTRGSFHYMALRMNAEKEKFFVSTQGVPGMGPSDVQVGDEIYAVKGCRALVVLRWVEREGTYVMVVVGLCFVDRWMYGRAMQGRCEWETLMLY